MEELKQKVIDLCNSSGLPLECIVFVLKDAWRDAEDTLRRASTGLLKEQKEEQEDA